MADFTDSTTVSASTCSLPISIHISTALIGLWRPRNAHQDKTNVLERRDEDEDYIVSRRSITTDITHHEDSRDGSGDDNDTDHSSGVNLQGPRRDSPDVTGKYLINCK